MTERFIGAGQPLALTRPASYRMQRERYDGHVLYITFETEFDLSRWVPAPLVPVHPHRGFLKIYELNRVPDGRDIRDVGYTTYNEVCVTVPVRLDGEGEERHYNVFMYLDRDWAIYKAREVLGWPKKFAQIDITWPANLDGDDTARSRGRRNAFGARISRWGHTILDVQGVIDDELEPTPIPPFNGFYSIYHRVVPDRNQPQPAAQVYRIDTENGWASTPHFGTATVQGFDIQDEELGLLGDITVTGCSYREVGWELPAWPATLVREVELYVDNGD